MSNGEAENLTEEVAENENENETEAEAEAQPEAEAVNDDNGQQESDLTELGLDEKVASELNVMFQQGRF